MNIPCTLIPNVFVNSSSVIMHRKKIPFRNFSVLLFNGIFHIVQGCFCF